MKKGRVRQLLAAALLAGLTGGVMLPVAVPSLIIRSGDKLDELTRRRGRNIAEHAGVVFLVTFDEPEIREWISGATCLAPGTQSVPALLGRGRRFNGRLQTFVETPIRWSRIKPDYTISLWVNLDGRSTTQDILFRSGNAQQTGFRLEGGILKFDVPAPDGNYQTLECPFKNFDEFTHLAAVVSRTDGRAALYLNGERRAEGAVQAVEMPEELIEFGKRQWFAARHPVQGIIDETVIWNRTLEPEEIRWLARSRRGALARLSSPAVYLRWRLFSLLASLCRHAAGISNAARAGMGGLLSPGEQGSLPRLDLYLSNSDRRHFAAAHRASLESGRRTDRAANFRDICFSVQGEARRGRLQLYGSDTSYANNRRPSYILQALEGEIRPGTRRLLLSPPENVSFLLPLVERELASVLGIPAVEKGLLTLQVNSQPQGVYYYEDWDTLGVTPGDYPELFRGPRYRKDWKTPFRYMEQPLFFGRLARYILPLDGEALKEIFDRVSHRFRPVLMNDPASFWSRAERAHQIDRSRERLLEIWQTAAPDLSAAQRAADFLSEYLVVGDNPSPDRVTTDLDLSGPRLGDVAIEWSSSQPAIIDAAGRVTRPAGCRPVAVRMTAAINDGTEVCSRVLTFRVMPEQINVPSLMVYARRPVQKVRRVDARIDYYPADPDSDPRTLWATQQRRGGISHRGNTSYWKVKKLLSFRTDTPHEIFGESRSRHLQCINSLEDETFLRNRLCYDLFRGFGSKPDRRYAPRVAWAEVFCNGVYQGLYEICERVDEQTLGFNGSDPELEHPPVIYKHETVEPRVPYMRQERPNRRHGLFMEPFLDLDEFLTRADTGVFISGLADRFDLGNALDFHLLLNLTQNLNGYPFTFSTHDILAHSGRPEDRFFLVPWDFAVTFRLYWRWRWMANGMQRRLQEEFPGYRVRLRERWTDLRREVLDADKLAESINTHAGRIRDYARWDYARWNYPPRINHEDAVSDLITVVRGNIEKMDEFLADWDSSEQAEMPPSPGSVIPPFAGPGGD